MMAIRRRPAVNQFSIRMEERLRRHDDRLGWETCSSWWLFQRMQMEFGEALEAIFNKRGSEQVANECADAANFLMMVADNALRREFTDERGE